MELCSFRERIYGKKDNQLFVFEPTWDSFRPIEKVAWNGDIFVIVDTKYTSDLFDEYYGYGSLVMKALCRQLSQDTELDESNKIVDPLIFWKWCKETDAKWWFDRPCVFTSSCIPKDQLQWKSYIKYIQTKAKTLRRPLKGRMTRRLVPK